jgi:hypothetical protein
MIKAILAAFVLTLTAEQVEAQIPSTATPLAPAFAAGCAAQPVLDELTLRFNQGDWPAFQREARALLDALRRPAPAGGGASPASPAATCASPATLPAAAVSALDYTTRHVALVWIGADALGRTQLMRAIVRSPEPPAYSADLPGVAGLTEVFVAGSVSARAASLYISTPEDDPFAGQLSAFVQALFTPLAATVGGILGRVTGRSEARVFEAAVEPPQLGVTISGVVLPVARASIQLTAKARDLVTVVEFTDAVAEVGTKLRFNGAGRSNAARAQIDTLVDQLPEVASENCAAAGGASPSSVSCRGALDMLIKSAYDAAVAVAGADTSTIDEVDREFRALALDALSTNAELEVTFKNRPLTHFAFGAGSAVMGYARLNRVRATLDDGSGSLASDPLPRVMTMAFLNWSPGGYDEASATVSRHERTRVFFGAALTPDFGIVGGVNVLLQRGIGLIGGAGFLFGKGAEADEIGTPPAATADPFKLAISRTAFVGISYNFE